MLVPVKVLNIETIPSPSSHAQIWRLRAGSYPPTKTINTLRLQLCLHTSHSTLLSALHLEHT